MCPIISRALDTTAAASVCVKPDDDGFLCVPDGFLPPPQHLHHATHNPEFPHLDARVVAPLWQQPLFIEARKH